MSRFFISCQIGLEDVLEIELESFWHLLIDLDGLPTRSRPEIILKDLGGLEIETEYHLGLQINFFSKLANRVLFRLSKFECRYFDQFEKELKKLNLNPYFKEALFDLKIESSKSRLFHEANLKETALKVFKNSKFITTSNEDLNNETLNHGLFIRIYKDSATVSIDTSGRLLHKRGYRLQQGAAPIRETLAAQMIYFLYASIGSSVSESEFNLFDPFVGSGTLLFEAASFYTPQVYQNNQFIFEKFDHLPALFKSPTWKKNFKIENRLKLNLLGFDLSRDVITKAHENLEKFRTLYPDLESNFNFKVLDSALIKETDLGFKSNIFVTNPPYGERLVSQNVFKVLSQIDQLENVSAGIIVHPSDWNLPFKRLKMKHKWPFNNQGLKLDLTFWSIF